jgi:glycosyltransferase involved in cell wall biosynthesis
MNVAFVNENTLGHASYLLPFVEELRKHPELGIEPHVIDATPLPPSLSHWANFSVRGLRKWGLDFGSARWRMTVSSFVRQEVNRLGASHVLDAIVVNTQSVALELAEMAAVLPVFVCFDATFEQLAASPWFAPNLGSRLFLPVTSARIRGCERRLFEAAHRLIPWSEAARQSLLKDYHCSPEKIRLLPPSIDLRSRKGVHKTNARPQILFVGGDFYRKGGVFLLECYRRWFSTTCDLHLVTHSPIEPEAGVYVHHNVQPYSAAWFERWLGADVFLFPSTLETFGIVLLEALAFQVPVISSDVGAARFVLAGGRAGRLLEDRKPETMAGVLREVLRDSSAARQRALEGRKLVEECFDLSRNTQRLANWLQEAVAPHAMERFA